MQMQDVDLQSINTGGGVVAGKVLLSRLTPHHHHHHHHPQPPQQPPQFTTINNNYLHQPQQQAALKCPRCDSSNTKFCYYNNYNLSQPRHFCKNCRRYWTKGGVLRNVPVGGGCRKSKRSSKPKSPSATATTTTTTAVCSSSSGGNSVHPQDPPINSSHSTTESSAAAGGASGGALFQIPEIDNLETLVDSSPNNTNLFSSDDIGNFMSLNNKCDNNVNVNDNDNGNSTVAAEATSFSEFLRNQEWEMGKIICGVHRQEDDKLIAGSTAVDLVDVDPTVRIEDLLQNRGSNNVGISTLDWHLTADNSPSLFDVADNSTVDHHDYWTQSSTAFHHHDDHNHDHDTQWSDSTTAHFPLFLP